MLKSRRFVYGRMGLLETIRIIRKSFSLYIPSVEITISKGVLLRNFKQYQAAYPDFLLAPVLKSNAYGHGLVVCAQILDKEQVAFFVVDSLFEAKLLRSAGIKKTVLVIGYVNPINIRHAHKNIVYTITSLAQLKEVSSTLFTPRRFHLKLDTGMHRQGIMLSELDEAIRIFEKNRLLQLEGVCTHFADADNDDETFSKEQCRLWREAQQKIKAAFPNMKVFHVAATSGARFAKEAGSSVIRVGLGLYGIDPSPRERVIVEPVLQLETVISGIKIIEKGECVGYNCTFQASKTMKIATLPLGYYEGIDRRLSNVGSVKIHNQICPIVGRVSMNITSVDVSAVSNVKEGDRVVVFSRNTKDGNSVDEAARVARTIPYDLLVRLPPHLRRTVIA